MSTLTLRATSGLKPKSLATFSQTRSKLTPTSSPRPLTTGLPELPPVVSASARKQTGTSFSSGSAQRLCGARGAAASRASGASKGSTPVCFSTTPETLVRGRM